MSAQEQDHMEAVRDMITGFAPKIFQVFAGRLAGVPEVPAEDTLERIIFLAAGNVVVKYGQRVSPLISWLSPYHNRYF